MDVLSRFGSVMEKDFKGAQLNWQSLMMPTVDALNSILYTHEHGITVCQLEYLHNTLSSIFSDSTFTFSLWNSTFNQAFQDTQLSNVLFEEEDWLAIRKSEGCISTFNCSGPHTKSAIILTQKFPAANL